MTYALGEALILTQVQAVSGFSSTNAVRGRWNLLSSGKAKTYCILRPGGHEETQGGLGGFYHTRWTTIAELWVHLKDYGADTATLEAARQGIIAKFRERRKAADTTGTIQDVTVRMSTDPFEMFPPSGKGAFLRQDLFIEWMEQTSVTLSE